MCKLHFVIFFGSKVLEHNENLSYEDKQTLSFKNLRTEMTLEDNFDRKYVFFICYRNVSAWQSCENYRLATLSVVLRLY